jgi:hypothetical protein
MIFEALFPDVRAHSFDYCFWIRRGELYVRQLTRESPLALRTVQKELVRLGAIDLVLSRSNGHHPVLPR